MPNENREHGDVKVLLVENMTSQAKNLHDELENSGFKVSSFLLYVPSQNLDKRSLPMGDMHELESYIAEFSPTIVLVDICLDEYVIDIAKERRATWTGPAVMAEIRQCFPNQKMASYSAYSRFGDVYDDIISQRRQYGVDDTPHWNVYDVSTQNILGVI